MSARPASESNRSLTQEAFNAFLSWLSTDHGQAAKEYLGIRQMLVKFFVRKGCARAEELADRTLDRVAVIVHHEPDKYPNAVALCCGVARRVWLESLREPIPGALENDNIPTPIRHSVDFTEHEVQCLESCLGQLPNRDRELITKYHQFQGSQKIEIRKQLAEVHGGLNKLRIMAYRIRVRLHECVNGCVQHSA